MDHTFYCLQDSELSTMNLDTKGVEVEVKDTYEVNTQIQDMELEANLGSRKRKGEAAADTSHSSEEAGWTRISRDKKIVRRAEKESEETNIQVCITSPTTLPKQFALAKILQQHKINNIIKVKYVNSSKILVYFNNQVSADKLIQTKAFSDMEWKCYKTSEVSQSYGVIRNVDLDITEEDILKALSSAVTIISVKRLNKRSNEKGGLWIPSESVRIGFSGTSVPSCVYIHEMCVKVDPYTFPVTQCGKCWKFGHLSKFCPKNNHICPKCGDQHDNCMTTTFKCPNCQGPHMALQKICPVYKKEKRVRELMAEFNVTYRKALSMYISSTPISERLARFDGEHQLSMAPSASTYNVTNTTATVGTSKTDNLNIIPSYAEIVKNRNKEVGVERHKVREESGSSIVEKDKSSKKRRKQARQNVIASESDIIDESSENESPLRETSTPKCAKSDKDFSMLLKKLKDIIFSRNSIQSKVELAFKVLVEWVIIKLVSYVTDSSLLSSLFNG